MHFVACTLARFGLGVFAVAVLGACGGVAPDAVRDTTGAITAHVALAKAALVSCRGGDRVQCDSAEKTLQAIATENAELSRLADQ